MIVKHLNRARRRWVCITAMLILLSACAAMRGREIPLNYVGTIILGDIQRSGDSIDIPVSFQDSMMNSNSALMFKNIKTERKGKYIYITVRVYPKGKQGEPGEQTIHIDDIEPGAYYVYYRNPNTVIQSVKDITIPES